MQRLPSVQLVIRIDRVDLDNLFLCHIIVFLNFNHLLKFFGCKGTASMREIEE